MSKSLKLGLLASGILLSNAALASNNGWYVSGKIGTSFVEASDQHYENRNGAFSTRIDWGSKTKAAFNVGVQGGYNFAPHYGADVRLELDNTYRTKVKSTKSLSSIGLTDVGVTTKATLYSTMINAHFDIDTSTAFTPYVSAGIGLSTADVKFSVEDSSVSKTKVNFAWSAGTGVYYSINPQLGLDLGYRYLDAGKAKINDDISGIGHDQISAKFKSHDVTLGLRYSF